MGWIPIAFPAAVFLRLVRSRRSTLVSVILSRQGQIRLYPMTSSVPIILFMRTSHIAVSICSNRHLKKASVNGIVLGVVDVL